MDNNADNLKKLLDQIRSVTLWNRIFNWKRIKDQLYDAITDLQRLCSGIDSYKEQCHKAELKYSDVLKDLDIERKSIYRKDAQITELANSMNEREKTVRELELRASAAASTLASMNDKINALEKEKAEQLQQARFLNDELKRLREENGHLKKEDEFRKNEHSKALFTLNKIQTQVQDERQREVTDRNNAEIERIKRLKETWSAHQETVRNTIKTICSRHTIDYVEKVPFKGDPDNTLKIADEFIIFDAKSPAGEDLNNFPLYIKDQAERAKKYCREENVRKEIFLVVPFNTLPRIKQFVYHLADYTVFVVSLDTLEPLILSLKKLEEYEFMENLTPEERENICRVLGKFAHLAKRRIQIDTFFIKQFIELAYKCESDLPPEILEKVIEFEKAEKLNPPTERRSKLINIKELEKDALKLKNETTSKGIAVIEEIISAEINKMPLYTQQPEEELVADKSMN
jgi:hypothetical protein